MKKKIALILINIIICYILFFRIDKLFYYTLIIPFLLTLVNTDATFRKYYIIILIPMFYFNILNASIILISYLVLYYVYKKLNIKYLYLTSFILSATISLIFKYYYHSTFFILAPILSLTITLYQLKFKNTPNEVLIFLLISLMILIDNNYFISISLISLFLYIIFNKSDYLFMVSFLLMGYHFYLSNDYIVLIYPLITYLSMKKEILFGIIISLLLLIYCLYIKELTINVILSLLLITLLLLSTKGVKINTDYFPILLDSFNNEIMNFCSFLDNFKNTKEYTKDNFNTITNSITQNFCISCKKRYECFGINKLKTYEYFKHIIKQLDINKITFYCNYKTDIVTKVYSLLKTYPVDFTNNSNTQVNKISQALREYSIDLASKDVNIFSEYTNLKKELIDYGFTPIIFEPNCIKDGIDIKIGFEKRFNNIAPKLLQICSKIFKTDVSVKLVSNNTMYSYYIVTNKVKYNVIFDSLSVAKNNYIISGDNIFTHKYDNGYFKAAIADGMGSGFDAFELSKETISLVEKISNQNLSDFTSINILNTFYSLNDHYDIYSTLDYISIDLKTGKSILYKMGATTTFVIKQSQIIPIYNQNLPFGIDDLIVNEEIILDNNDLVIMVSDGVSEHIDEYKLTTYLNEIKDDAPHQIVYNIMQKVYDENNKVIKDDMSIIAIKIVSQS